MKKKLDFLIIGAMRSGTTSLYELLRHHPEIAMPAGKEVPFFSENNEYKNGLNWYLKRNFDGYDPKNAWGTITPQYLYIAEGRHTKTTARRIKKDNPNVKLIAILRNPIERSFSHYNFAIRHNHDHRSFDQAVEEILNAKSLDELQKKFHHKYSYLSRSLYGESLKPYFELFKKKNILVLFTDDLEKHPKETIIKICKFIGVDPEFNPPGLGETFHKGGAKPKINLLTPGRIGKVKPVMQAYRLIIPYRARKRFEIWFHAWNTKKDDSRIEKRSKVYKTLVDYFRNDVKLLESFINKKTPWSDWK